LVASGLDGGGAARLRPCRGSPDELLRHHQTPINNMGGVVMIKFSTKQPNPQKRKKEKERKIVLQ
jgi:hypothetical protein